MSGLMFNGISKVGQISLSGMSLPCSRALHECLSHVWNCNLRIARSFLDFVNLHFARLASHSSPCYKKNSSRSHESDLCLGTSSISEHLTVASFKPSWHRPKSWVKYCVSDSTTRNLCDCLGPEHAVQSDAPYNEG